MTTGIFGVYIFSFRFQFFDCLFKLQVHLCAVIAETDPAGFKQPFVCKPYGQWDRKINKV